MKLDAVGAQRTIPNTRRSVFVGNPSTWGPAARRHLQQSPCDVVGYVETHMNPAASEDLLRDFDRAGRKAVLSPARPKSGGTLGGVAWGALKRYQASSYRQLARHESQCLGADRALDVFPPGEHLDFFDFVPLCLHLKGVNLVLILLYLTCSIGFTGENLQKISSLLAFIQCINDPWIVSGDLNVSPSTLLAQTWFQDMGLQVLVPDNFEMGPKGSLIDFAFAPAAGAAFVDSITFDDQVPWKTHFGLSLTIKADAADARIRQFPAPRRFRRPPRPRKPADPDSKSSKKRAAQAPKERERMEENARRAAARHLRVQEMRARHLTSTPVPMWQAPMSMRLDLDDSECEHEREEDFPQSPRYDDWQEQPEAQPPELDLVEPPVPHETPQGEPPVNTQQTWEADQLWYALHHPLSDHSSPPHFVESSAAFRYDREGAKLLGRSFEQWMTSLETFYCTAYTIPLESRFKYCGRASTREPRLCIFRPRASTSPQFANPVALWWRTLATHLDLLYKPVRQRASNMIEALLRKMLYFGKPISR